MAYYPQVQGFGSALKRGDVLRAWCLALVLCSSLAEAVDASSVFYLARPRAVGRRVPPSLLFDLQGKLKALVKRNNRLLVEGEEDAQLVSGPEIDRRALLKRVDQARSAHEELDLEAARSALRQVIQDLGALPLTPDAREVWRDVNILLIEIAEAEQDLLTRDRTIDELLRVMPRLQPRQHGLSGNLADLVVARKASLKPAVGAVIRMRPADAKVWVDGRPTAAGDRLRPGSHRLLVRAQGHRAYIEVFEVESGAARVELQASLSPARLRSTPELDEALSSPDSKSQVIGKMGDVVRQAGASIGILATVGRRSDGRFNLHIAAVARDGSVAGVGTMVTGGLLAENDLAHLIGAASRRGVGVPIATGDWRSAQPMQADIPDPSDFEGLPASERRASLPGRRLRQKRSTANLWIVSTVALLGGSAAYLLYSMQEAPVEEVFLEPTMSVEANLP